MSYIGSTPTTQSFIAGTDYFNGDGSTTAFTLSRSVVSTNDIEAVINNVEQQPNTAYTVSGTTITFTSAPSAGTANIYVRYLSTTTQSITPSQGTVNNSSFGNVTAIPFVAGPSLGAGDASIMKNRIINGAMVIDQRNAGASVTPVNAYTLDRWRGDSSTASKYTVQQNAGSVTPPVGFVNYLGVTSTSAYSVAAGDYYAILQNIEGYNIADLGWGTANAKTVTLSFWVRSSLTGTFGGSLYGGQVYPFSYTISAANTWEQKSITIAGSTSGSWNSTNGIGINVNFGLGVGSTYSGTAGAWTSGFLYSATGATSVVGTSGATFYITGVQLEVGSSATGFEYVNYQTSLANCQRYFQSNFDIGTAPQNGIAQAYSNSTTMAAYNVNTGWIPSIAFRTTMRAVPTVTLYSSSDGSGGNWATYDGSSWTNVTGQAFNSLSTNCFNLTLSRGSAFTAKNSYLAEGNWAASAEL